MKTTKTSAKRAALIAVLVLGSSAWLSAQTNQGRSGQPGIGQDRQQNRYGTNSQYNQGRSGQAEGGLGRQQDNFAGTRSANAQSPQPLKINKGSSLIGTTVKNHRGMTLGEVSDVVIDFRTERVSYVVLDGDLGPHPGMKSEPTEVMAKPAYGGGSIVPLVLYPPGYDLSSLVIYDPAVSKWANGGSNATERVSSRKLHAVPLRALQSDPAGTSLILNVNPDQFAASAGFDKDNWPAVTTAVWGAEPSQKTPEKTSDAQQLNEQDQQKIKAQRTREK